MNMPQQASDKRLMPKFMPKKAHRFLYIFVLYTSLDVYVSTLICEKSFFSPLYSVWGDNKLTFLVLLTDTKFNDGLVIKLHHGWNSHLDSFVRLENLNNQTNFPFHLKQKNDHPNQSTITDHISPDSTFSKPFYKICYSIFTFSLLWSFFWMT